MASDLIRERRAVQHLLDARSPGDGLASYYALHHAQDRTTLLVHRNDSGRADGFLVLCRTGLDLFRPLLTLRAETMEVTAGLVESALPPQASVIIAVPLDLGPVIEALFTISEEKASTIYQLNYEDFRPIINVLATRAPTPGGDPRFVIRGQSLDRGARPAGPVLATAGINWRSPHFADIYVQTDPRVRGRKLGRSVVSALSNWLLEQKIIPLYTVPDANAASVRLAQGLGYHNTGERTLFCSGVRRSAAFPFPTTVVE